MEILLISAISITLTWFKFKILGGILLVLSLVALFFGDLPDNAGSSFGNGLRWIAWPLFFVWVIVFLIRSIIL